MKTVPRLSFPILFLTATLSGFLATQAAADPVPVRAKNFPKGNVRAFKARELSQVSQINFKNDTGTRTGFITRNSENKDDDGNPVQGWSFIMNGEIFAEALEVKRGDSAIFLKQENSTEEYQLDLKTGRILNRNQDRKEWAQILQMTLALLDY